MTPLDFTDQTFFVFTAAAVPGDTMGREYTALARDRHAFCYVHHHSSGRDVWWVEGEPGNRARFPSRDAALAEFTWRAAQQRGADPPRCERCDGPARDGRRLLFGTREVKHWPECP